MSTMKELRKSLGLTQKQFGEKYGIPRRTIEDWDRGVKTPPVYWVNIFKRLLLYENLYGVDMGEDVNE